MVSKGRTPPGRTWLGREDRSRVRSLSFGVLRGVRRENSDDGVARPACHGMAPNRDFLCPEEGIGGSARVPNRSVNETRLELERRDVSHPTVRQRAIECTGVCRRASGILGECNSARASRAPCSGAREGRHVHRSIGWGVYAVGCLDEVPWDGTRQKLATRGAFNFWTTRVSFCS